MISEHPASLTLTRPAPILDPDDPARARPSPPRALDGPGGPLAFRPGWRSAVDFRRERGRPAVPADSINVRRVRMIHPYWDMALLEVDGLPAARSSLRRAATAAPFRAESTASR